MTQPVVYMIAGPNGAGKTTAAMRLLPDFLAVHEFVNADEIAHGLNPLNQDQQAMTAGRLMLERIDSLMTQKKNFAFETTGPSHVFADRLKTAKTIGYRVGLIYLWLPGAEMAKLRVQSRVAQGGHNIPAKDIERRYGRGLKNLLEIYLPLADEGHIINSMYSFTDRAEIIAQKNGADWRVYKQVEWDSIQHYGKGGWDE